MKNSTCLLCLSSPIVLLATTLIIIAIVKHDGPPEFTKGDQATALRTKTPNTKPLTWSLDGAWSVTRVSIAGQEPVPDWSSTWTIKDTPPKYEIASVEKQGNTSSAQMGTLETVEAKDKLYLKWYGGMSGARWFLIKDQSFGYLDMIDPDGYDYIAVRSDGGHPLKQAELPEK